MPAVNLFVMGKTR